VASRGATSSILDFLGLKDTYAEKDVEAAIPREMEAFILEPGVGFCFVAGQQRMQIDEAVRLARTRLEAAKD
jgi:predicted nuclease of restriction endonuclease-like (RecB) superfamily